MNSGRLILALRIVIAVVLGTWVFRCAGAQVERGDIGSAVFAVGLVVLYGFVLFFLFGSSIIGAVSRRFENLYVGRDDDLQILPEYSLAEAQVKKGRYQEAVDEYRQVILEYPEDIYPHLRIAELAVKHLNDVKLAELELLSAMGKAKGEDSTALAAGRLADFYQHTLQEPARALEVMKQLREKIPGTKQAKLAEERIVLLESIAHGGVVLAETPDKIAHRPSRYNMWE